MINETASLTLTELLAEFRGGSRSPVDAVAAAYDRIEAHNRDLNLFCHQLARDEAMAEAEDAARRWACNSPLGPLDGVPLTVKDGVLTAAGGLTGRVGRRKRN